MKENILNDSEVQSLINFVNSDEMITNRRLKLTTLASVMECNNLNSEMRSDLLNASLLYQSHLIELLYLTNQSINLNSEMRSDLLNTSPLYQSHLIELLHLTNQSINLLLESKCKTKKRCQKV